MSMAAAGSSLPLSMYGPDQYIEQYDLEVGFPWQARDNVPIAGSAIRKPSYVQDRLEQYLAWYKKYL
ncbi:MAG: hypothetical protein ACRD96_00795 [Bryobacteraceae bacterium]